MGPELETQREKDRAVREQIQRYSDASKPHRIEYHFLTGSRTGGTELREWARLHGFQVSPLQEGHGEGRRSYHFDLIKFMIPTRETLAPDTALMLRLAAEFECTYAGWDGEVAP